MDKIKSKNGASVSNFDQIVSCGSRVMSFWLTANGRTYTVIIVHRCSCGVVDNHLPCKPGVAGSVPGFASLSDETLSHGPSPYDLSWKWDNKHKTQQQKHCSAHLQGVKYTSSNWNYKILNACAEYIYKQIIMPYSAFYSCKY